MKKIASLFIIALFSFIPSTHNSISEHCVSADPRHFSLSSPVRYPISMTGSFGELRNNHFHAGVDIRTNRGEGGDEILSAADGFVSRIKIDGGDYGKSIFIEHANGFTTMYAHCLGFRADLESYIKNEQYSKQKFKVDVTFPPGQFQVKAGEHIAYIGNTGASRGAHLHFELRETNSDKVFDPLLFGLPITDNISPLLRRVKLYGFDTYGNTVSEQIQWSAKINKNYTIYSVPGDLFSAGVDALDRSNNSWNWTGIKSIQMLIDGGLFYHYNSEQWSLNQTRDINAHIDYPSKLKAQGQFHRCFKLVGSKIDVYQTIQNDGIFYMNDGAVHNVQLIIQDGSGNSSQVEFGIKKSEFFKKEEPNSTTPSLEYNKSHTLQFTNQSYILFPEGCLFENFNYSQVDEANGSSNAFSNWIGINPTTIPLADYIEIGIKPNKELLPEQKEKCFIAQKRAGGAYVSIGGEWNGEHMIAHSKYLGSFAMMLDLVAPSLKPLGFKYNMSKSKFMSFHVQDNVPAIVDGDELVCDAFIDGQWILMDYDEKSHTVKHYFEDWLMSGKHELLIRLIDHCKNVKEYNYTFVR